jgi:hypothetical protein
MTATAITATIIISLPAGTFLGARDDKFGFLNMEQDHVTLLPKDLTVRTVQAEAKPSIGSHVLVADMSIHVLS